MSDVNAIADAAFEPEIFDAKGGTSRLLALTASGVTLVDRLRMQLEDLAQTRSPSTPLAPGEVASAVDKLVGPDGEASFGVYVHYPWKRVVVRLLPERMFVELRSDRNRHKILTQEQQRLRTRRIGIVGLSVGHAVATTMALEGVGGKFRLADMDALGLSNLNRLKASVLDLGLNKAIVAARAMYEIDPFLDIEIFQEGVTEANMPTLLGEGNARLDLLIEECDDFYAKVRVRELARERGIPVVMETSDGCMLDIERFDREPNRPVMHGLLDGVTADVLRGLSPADKVPYAMRVLDMKRMSTRTRASMLEIRQTLSTWPQLGSAVTLGGGVTTDTARRILLDEILASGRFKIDLELLVNDDTAVSPMPLAPTPADPWQPALPSPPREIASRAGEKEVRFVVEHALLAPSGGNAQPWRFDAREGEIDVILDRERAATVLDMGHFGSFCALGACAETMVLAAARIGYGARVEFANEGARISLSARGEPLTSPLYDAIAVRATSRHVETRVTIADGVVRRIAEAAGSHVIVIAEEDRLAELAACAAKGDQVRFLSERMHRELVSELRFTAEEALASRDGIDWRSLELPKRDAAAVDIFRDGKAMAFVGALGGGGGLGDGSALAMKRAALAMIVRSSAAERTPSSYFDLGRRVQRVWLTATRLGVAVQPVAVPFLAHVGDMPEGKTLTERERADVATLKVAYRAIVPDEGRAEMLLRLHTGGPPSVRARRRALEDVFRYE